MIQQTKKLRLDELQVDSFVTSASSSVVTIKGGTGVSDGNRFCETEYESCYGTCGYTCDPQCNGGGTAYTNCQCPTNGNYMSCAIPCTDTGGSQPPTGRLPETGCN